jgi:glycosyltransferase involved in cell wall biosynthesis
MPVLVIDHESSDATGEIARAHGAAVIARPFDGFVNARRFALSQVRTPWTLMIDADEVLDEDLRASIAAAPEDVDGYYLKRSTYFCGKPLRMWRGEKLLRLFRTDRATLENAPAAGGQAQIHEHWCCEGVTAGLNGTLLHYSYPSVASYNRKFAEYTDIEAAGAPGYSFLILGYSALGAILRFVYLLLVRRALLDGWRGVYVGFCSAFYPTVVRFKAHAKK